MTKLIVVKNRCGEKNKQIIFSVLVLKAGKAGSQVGDSFPAARRTFNDLLLFLNDGDLILFRSKRMQQAVIINPAIKYAQFFEIVS
jgi:hypothetical protein